VRNLSLSVIFEGAHEVHEELLSVNHTLAVPLSDKWARIYIWQSFKNPSPIPMGEG
jgi:hypothetical protein